MTEPTDAATSPLVHLVDPAPAAAKPAAAPAKAAPSPAQWADMSPDDRAGFQRREIDAANNTYRPPDRKPGEKVDDATYEKMTFAERSAYARSFQDKPATNPDGSPADPGEAPVVDPNDRRIKIGDDLDVSETEAREALAFKAAEDAKRLSLPATPGDYRLDLPADLRLPEGITFKFDANDPIRGTALTALREFAKAKGWTQQDFSEILGVYAASQSHEAKMIADGAKAEREKMGPAGGARIDAVTRFWKAHVGDEIARAILQTTVTERQVRGYEIMIQKFTNQGVSSFRGTGREAPDASGRLPSGAEGERMWNDMNYTQKKEYAERFPQR